MRGYAEISDSDMVRREFAHIPVHRPGPGFERIEPDHRPGPSRGCCKACIDQAWMTVLGNFADTYYVEGIPAAFSPTGGMSLSYVGLTSGITGVANGRPYWESDSFAYGCGGTVTDTIFWRMVIEAETPCYANVGMDTVQLYIVNAGSASNCGLAVSRCDTYSADPFPQYVNIEDLRGRCGTTLYFHYPQLQSITLEDDLPCKVCVYPKAPSGTIPPNGSGECCGPEASTCIEDYATDNSRTDRWPRVIYAEAVASTVTGLNSGDKIPMLWDGTKWTGTRVCDLTACESFAKTITATLSCEASGLRIKVIGDTSGADGYQWYDGATELDSTGVLLAAAAAIDETFADCELICEPSTGPDVSLGLVTWRIYE